MNGKKYLMPAIGAAALALVFVTACGKSSSPTSPSSSASLSSSPRAGASISGSVSGATGSSAAGYGKMDGGSGVTVTISGTNLTVAVDSNGKFVLTGVPAGTVELVFTSSGGTATITLPNVKDTDTITIKVTIKGATATLDTEERNGTPLTEIEDRITAINPNGVEATLTVGATLVSVPSGAIIRHGGTTLLFTDLKVGDRVHVRGEASATAFVATEVNVQNTNEKVPVNVSGAVSLLQGACPAITFTVDGWIVDTQDGLTTYQKTACAAITNGVGVHVKGEVQPETGHVLATWVQLK